MVRNYISRSSLVLSTLLLALLGSGCASGFTHSDRQALEEARRCPRNLPMESVAPPPGEYANQGIVLDYNRLAPRPDPGNCDVGYSIAVVSDPERLEQLYYDATHDNAQASWFLCQFEIGARQLGREAARYLSSLQCQTIASCKIDFRQLPFSQETASGQRIYEEAARAFEAEATRLGILHQAIADALSLYVGARIAERVLKVPLRPLPSFQTYPKDSVWSKPPMPRGLEIERRLGGNLPPKFKIIDRWKDGTTTSIKSVDLRASTYSNPNALRSKVKGYVDAVAKYSGGGLKDVRIEATEIAGRALDLVVPATGSAAQQQVLREMVQYGQRIGVKVSIIVMP